MAKEQHAVKETKKAKKGEGETKTAPASKKKEEKEQKAPNSVVKACIPCKPGPAATYQDKKYGQHQRVHVRTRQNSPIVQRSLKCTVCGGEKK